MINKKTLEMLSAYLDGEVNEAQKRQMEAMLAKDPALRKEAETMKAFNAKISATRPAPLKVPEGFRDEILKKLKHPQGGPDQSSGGSPGGGPGFIKRSWMNYLISGTVLAGLITYFVYQDHHNQQAINQAQESLDMVKAAAKGMDMDMPQYQGQATGQSFRSAAPNEINGLNVNQLPAGSFNQDLKPGHVFRYGQGGHKNRISANNDRMAPSTGGSTSVKLPRPALESSQGWDQQYLSRMINHYHLRKKITPEQCLTLAQKHTLNPGLLVSLMHFMPEQNSRTLAVRIRQSLNQSVRQEAPQRLEQLLHDLNGQPEWLAEIEQDLAP